ncbi:MAG: hydrogenase expression/formation protein HypE [Gammaproteobacteria bacterium]|nr:hydrogenase expression/formation protein HypE [Gammaproteobacteria bacterium]
MTHITLAHGNGGKRMAQLIETLFAPLYSEPQLLQCDAAALSLPEGELMITTDGFTVKPLEFPGGNIGSLAIHGTVNDLAVSGARAHSLTLNAFIEEGLELVQLERIIAGMARAAAEAGVSIVAGDTKVVPRGDANGLYLATTGIGIRQPGLQLAMQQITPGDRLLVSGPVGDHGTAVMLAREQFGLSGELCSDAASVHPLTEAILTLPGLRFMRDPTRGGLATVAHELVRGSGCGLRLYETGIPVRQTVRSVCDILGYDPLFLACEGRVVAAVAAEQADELLQRWQALPQGSGAALIGEFTAPGEMLVLETELGGERLLPELEDEPLPRIC